MDMQNVSNLVIPEGEVKNIHNKNSQLLWSKVAYNTKYTGDVFQQSYTGTNLFNTDTYIGKTISGDVTVIDENTFTMYDDGTNGGWKNVTFQVDNITANTDYSMKFIQTNTNTLLSNVWIVVRPTGGTSIINQTYSSGTQIHFNSGNTTSLQFAFYAQVGAGAVAPNTATVSKIQLNVGSSTGAYEPYTGGVPNPSPSFPSPISPVTGVQTIKVTGKNLLPKNAAGTTTKNNVKFVVDEYGAITVSGTASANTYFNLNKVTLGPGNYVLSGVPSTGSSSSFRIAFNFGGSVQSDFSVNGKTFTLSNTYTASEAFIFIAKDYEAKNIVFKPMIEYGSTKTLYEAYMERTFTVDLGSTKLYKISTYKDYIYPNNGNWYIHRENGTYTADGTENVSIASTTPAMIYIPNSEALEGQNNTLMSTHFRYEWANKIGACYVSGSGHKMACGVSGVNTVSAAQSWLSSNHPEFVYILSTPTDTQITDSTLISQLDAVNEWLTRYGYNATVTGNLPIIIDRTNL